MYYSFTRPSLSLRSQATGFILHIAMTSLQVVCRLHGKKRVLFPLVLSFSLSLEFTGHTFNACKGRADFAFFHLLFNIAHAVRTFISFISYDWCYECTEEAEGTGRKESRIFFPASLAECVLLLHLVRFSLSLCVSMCACVCVFAHLVKPSDSKS